MTECREPDNDGLDGGPIESFTEMAISINARVIQGQILAVDSEGQRLLERLAALVERYECHMRQGIVLAD